jgi:hypothetical protein
MQTLADLASHFELYGVCIACKRMARIDLHPLIQALGGGSTVAAVRERVRCRVCGARTRDIRIVYAGPCGNARGFHYRSHAHDAAPHSPSSSVPSSVKPKPATPT